MFKFSHFIQMAFDTEMLSAGLAQSFRNRAGDRPRSQSIGMRMTMPPITSTTSASRRGESRWLFVLPWYFKGSRSPMVPARTWNPQSSGGDESSVLSPGRDADTVYASACATSTL